MKRLGFVTFLIILSALVLWYFFKPKEPVSFTQSNLEITTNTPQDSAEAELSGIRKALVIGNNEYNTAGRFSLLKNCVRDANLIAETLRSVGFLVTSHKNLKTIEIGQALRAFEESIFPGDTTVIYFAGHGLEYEGNNYLLGTNALGLSSAALDQESHRATTFAKSMKQANRRFLFLDCCREPPSLDWVMNGRGAEDVGMVSFQPNVNNLITVHSTSPGHLSSDGVGDNSPFALSLSELLLLSAPHTEFLQDLISSVKLATNGKQVPRYNGNFDTRFYFSSKAPPSPPPTSSSKIANAKIKAEWDILMQLMQSDHAICIEMESGDYSIATKVKSWALFLADYDRASLNNPFSAKDTELIDHAKSRHGHWSHLLESVRAEKKNSNSTLKTDISSLETPLQRLLAESQWKVRMAEMQNTFEECKHTDIASMGARDKVEIWSSFLEAYESGPNNPYSSQDSEWLAHAKERRNFWEQQRSTPETYMERALLLLEGTEELSHYDRFLVRTAIAQRFGPDSAGFQEQISRVKSELDELDTLESQSAYPYLLRVLSEIDAKTPFETHAHDFYELTEAITTDIHRLIKDLSILSGCSRSLGLKKLSEMLLAKALQLNRIKLRGNYRFDDQTLVMYEAFGAQDYVFLTKQIGKVGENKRLVDSMLAFLASHDKDEGAFARHKGESIARGDERNNTPHSSRRQYCHYLLLLGECKLKAPSLKKATTSLNLLDANKSSLSDLARLALLETFPSEFEESNNVKSSHLRAKTQLYLFPHRSSKTDGPDFEALTVLERIYALLGMADRQRDEKNLQSRINNIPLFISLP